MMAARLPQLPSWRAFSTLQWALAVSVLVHAALLTVRFVNPEGFARAFQDNTLDVILVNAKSDEKPAKAQAIAQHSLAGGGEAKDARIVSTPLPPSPREAEGNDAIDENRRQIDHMQRQQELLLAQVREQLQKLLAAIEKRVEEENARPRKRYLSPATLGATYATYYDDMRRKIEQVGTANFPHVAGRKLYGELLMALLINHDGRILDARVVRGSGNRMLDRLAEAIAQKAAPFGPFTPAMRKDTDQFDVTARFRFTHEQTLETTLQADELSATVRSGR